jgi:hypothetical protein
MSGILQKGARRFTTQIGAAGVPDAVATTIPLVSTTGLPTDTEIEVVIDRTDGSGILTPSKEEVVRGTVSGLNLINCIRGVEGTAQAHGAGATVNSFLTASMWNNVIDYIKDTPNRGLIGGVINVSVASNNLTVAIKTLQGTDPSATNPVGIWIGNTLRWITSSLSISANAGTNWFNAGSAELATREIDYFAYIGYNATDGVVLGYARIPYARLYSDFNTTTTNEKYARISTITNAAAGDNYVNVGRFAATLSATASFNWTVPTFTNANLIQEPIFNTRTLRYKPTFTPFATMTIAVSGSEELCRYKIDNDTLEFYYGAILIFGGTADPLFKMSLPLVASTNGATGLNGNLGIATGVAEHTNGAGGQSFIEFGSLSQLTVRNEAGNYTLGAYHHRITIQYLLT